MVEALRSGTMRHGNRTSKKVGKRTNGKLVAIATRVRACLGSEVTRDQLQHQLQSLKDHMTACDICDVMTVVMPLDVLSLCHHFWKISQLNSLQHLMEK